MTALILAALLGSNTVTLPTAHWDDVPVPGLVIRVPAASAPTFQAFPAGSNTYLYCFPDGSDTFVHASFQLPHGYQEGTDAKLHLHWAGDTDPNATQTVRWVYDYTGFFGVGETFAASTQSHAAGSIDDDEQNVSQVTDLVTLTGTNFEISDIAVLRLWRDGDGTLGTDDYTGSACLLGFDWHIRVDTRGSPLETAK